ncbi:MAG: CHAD domain-containing protein [bacterium]|nr:CHAD domain-containing protein [bacterium]
MHAACTLGARAARTAVQERVAVVRQHVLACSQHDVDGVHDLRVASRRLRAILVLHAPCLGADARAAFLRSAKHVTRRLGKARELDVSVGILAERRDAAKGPARQAANHALRRLRTFRKAQSPSVDDACATVESPQFDARLRVLDDTVRETDTCHIEHAVKTLGKRFRRLCRAHEQWKKHPDEEHLHQIRIRFKKLRYTCEAVAELYDESMPRFVTELKATQDCLGTWNDLRVLRNYVASLRDNAPDELGPGFSELTRALNMDIETQLGLYAERSKPFFSGNHRKRVRNWFASPSETCCREAHGPQPPAASDVPPEEDPLNP